MLRHTAQAVGVRVGTRSYRVSKTGTIFPVVSVVPARRKYIPGLMRGRRCCVLLCADARLYAASKTVRPAASRTEIAVIPAGISTRGARPPPAAMTLGSMIAACAAAAFFTLTGSLVLNIP